MLEKTDIDMQRKYNKFRSALVERVASDTKSKSKAGWPPGTQKSKKK